MEKLEEEANLSGTLNLETWDFLDWNSPTDPQQITLVNVYKQKKILFLVLCFTPFSFSKNCWRMCPFKKKKFFQNILGFSELIHGTQTWSNCKVVTSNFLFNIHRWELGGKPSFLFYHISLSVPLPLVLPMQLSCHVRKVQRSWAFIVPSKAVFLNVALPSEQVSFQW